MIATIRATRQTLHSSFHVSSLQVGRSIIALAQISVLLFSNWGDLAPDVAGVPRGPQCFGPSVISLFCLDGSQEKMWAVPASVGLLVLVVLGVVPAITSMCQWWVALSLATGLGLPDGGEQVAQVVTLILIFLCIGDWRFCAWFSPERARGGGQAVQGIALGGLWALRLQMAFIYLESGLAKLGVDDWLNGSAMYYVVRDPSFGASGILGAVLRAMTAMPLGVALMSWGTIVVEVAIGLFLLFAKRDRRLALYAVVFLHVGIIVFIGLWSFAMVMIGAVTIASTGDRKLCDFKAREEPPKRGDPSEVSHGDQQETLSNAGTT